MKISEFLTLLETDGKGPVDNREAVMLLLEQAERGLAQPFLDACFHAKFLVRSQDVMRRIGRGADGFDQIAVEFQSGVERTMTLLRTIVKEAPTERRDHFLHEHVRPEGEAFARFLSLCTDLARIKNWEVDGRPLPFVAAPSTPSNIMTPQPGMTFMKDLLRASRLALVLFIVLLIFDGPASILGWITAFIIVGLFVVVEYAAARHQQEHGA